MKNTDPYRAKGWTPAAVGCHWTRGDFTVSTYATANDSGYEIHRKGEGLIAKAKSWQEIERICDRRQANRRQETPQETAQ